MTSHSATPDVAQIPDDPDEIIAAVLSGQGQSDPYAYYDKLREIAPFHRSILPGTPYFLTRYEDVDAMFRSELIGHGEDQPLLRANPRFERSVALQDIAGSMAEMDPPQHTRLRSLVNRVFTPKTVAGMSGYITELTDQVLADLDGKDEFDIVPAISYRIPSSVTSEMLGVPRGDHKLFSEWIHTTAGIFGPGLTEAELIKIDDAVGKFQDYLRELIVERKKNLREGDFLSELIQASVDGGKLDEMELIHMCTLLLGAGTETTETLIAMGMTSLLENPDQKVRLSEDPSLAPFAIEEFLRHNGPALQARTRIALDDVTLPGGTIPKGTPIIGVIAAANHDPEVFTDPQTLDIGRSPNPHLGFGGGIHMCLGARLSRHEGAYVINTLLERFPEMRLAGEPEWSTGGGGGVRAIESVPVNVAGVDGR